MRFSTNQQSAMSVYFAIIIGLLMTAILIYLAYGNVYEQTKENTDKEAVAIKDDITRKINTIEEALYGMRSLFDASTQVEADEFRILANNLLQRHPYIISTMYLKRVQNDQRARFENNMEDNGYINFSIKDKTTDNYVPAPTRELYFPVLYKEPFTPINAKQLGHDNLSIDKLKQIINRVIDTGKTATSPILANSNRMNAYTIFIAVYAGKTVPSTQSKRRANISGVIALQVDATKLVPTPLYHDVTLKLREQQNVHFTELVNHQRISSLSSNDWILNLVNNSFPIETDAEQYTVSIHTPIFWHEIDKTLIVSAALTGLLITLLKEIKT